VPFGRRVAEGTKRLQWRSLPTVYIWAARSLQMQGNRITARLCACRYSVDEADAGLLLSDLAVRSSHLAVHKTYKFLP